MLAPHAPGVPAAWEERGVRVETFRYAPEGWENLGYSRSLERDETLRASAALVAPLYALAGRRAVAKRLAREPFDLVQAHWVVPNALLTKPFAKRVALAVGLHGSDVFLAEKAWLRPFVRRALRQTAVLTGCSPELVRRVCDVGFPAARARVIPYGVDVGTFHPGPDNVGWRQRLGIPAEAPLLLSVGRMATKKGYQHLMPILGPFFERCPAAHLVLAGGGDRLAEFEAASRLWRQQVHFPGAVLRDDLPDLYRAADLFVLPAVHDPKGNVDGLPNVILEAMASGLAVVASEVSGIPLAVANGRTGTLVPEGDEPALLAALVALAGDVASRRAMGEEGRRFVERELTWDVIASRYREAYELGRASQVAGFEVMATRRT